MEGYLILNLQPELTLCKSLTFDLLSHNYSIDQNSVGHFLEFLPGVTLSDKVNYFLIFLKGAINCALNIWDGLKAIDLPYRPQAVERHWPLSFADWRCALQFENELLKDSSLAHSIPESLQYCLRWNKKWPGFVTAKITFITYLLCFCCKRNHGLLIDNQIRSN